MGQQAPGKQTEQLFTKGEGMIRSGMARRDISAIKTQWEKKTLSTEIPATVSKTLVGLKSILSSAVLV